VVPYTNMLARPLFPVVGTLISAFAFWSVSAFPVHAQGRAAALEPATPPPNASTDPLLRGFSFRAIGPATMAGRVDDIQGCEKDPMIIYVGFATGGLWKSTDGGLYWHSLFDNMPNESIGAIGIAPSDPNIVYVGTGEANNRQSSSIGDGVWSTTDGGKTWHHLGLDKVQSIDRIAVDPTNPNIVFVASPGHLFGPNPERGLYKTTDGGKTWKPAKYMDPYTGFNDVAIDPSNPKIVYASSFQRQRTWWGYNGGGAGSALWKSVDGGNTWTKLDGPGWPKPKDGIYGRIAISIFRNKPTTIYAQVEAGASAGTGGGTTAEGGPARGGRGGAAESGETPAGAGAGGGGRARGAAAPPNPSGSGVFRSDDGGKTWQFMSNQNQRPTYFSQIRVDPVNDKKLFVGGTPAQMSLDGGKTWTGLDASHTDYHAFWINPKDPRTVWVGHDGGIDVSNDGGYHWDFHNDMAVGQFYQISADMRRPYYVCGGLQDNNAWCGPSALRSTTGPVNTDWYQVAGGDGFYTRQDPTDWAIVYAESQDAAMSRHDLRTGTQKSIRPSLGPGRGGTASALATASADAPPPGTMTPTRDAASDPANGAPPAAAQGGRGGRGGALNIVNPPPNAAEPFRFYWNAPFEISPHNPAVVYMAAQYFFKSTNRGDTWWMNPADLSKNVDRWAPRMSIMEIGGDQPMAEKHDGYSASSLATQVRESPSKPGVIWIGTDDGNLQLSQDGGETFTNVIDNIADAPKGYVQISRIEPSHFDPATAYVALDNHRNDDWKPYLFKTTDYGKTWTNVTGNLPEPGNINALREDYDNPRLLFVGTEFGLFVTVDGGAEWKKFMTNLPSVRVDDILIHPRDRDLIIATHGRSIWIADDITPLERLKEGDDRSLILFDPRAAIQWKNDPQAQRHAANREFKAQNPQGGTPIHIWAKTELGKGKVEFLQNNQVVSTMDVDIKGGMNRFQWNMLGPAPAAASTGGRDGRGAAAEPAGASAATGNTGARPSADEPQSGAPAAAGPGPQGGGGGRGGRGNQGVPFVTGGGRGGGGFGFGAPQGSAVQPGTYFLRLTVAGQTLTSSVDVLEDIWMRPQ
jgi:photosystem II stability/assembly factor-like uncharacterized protein